MLHSRINILYKVRSDINLKHNYCKVLYFRGVKFWADFKIGHIRGVLNSLPDSLYVPRVNIDSMHMHHII